MFVYVAITALVVFVLIITAELFFGWRRGFKKSLIRLLTGLAMSAVAFCLTLLFSEKLILIFLNGAGFSGDSLSGIISPLLERFLSSESAEILSPALSGLAISLVSPVIFLASFLIFRVLYCIVSSIIFKIRNKTTSADAVSETIHDEIPVDTSENPSEIKSEIITQIKSGKRDNILGAVFGFLTAIIIVSCAGSFLLGDIQYISQIAPTVIEVATEKPPISKEEINDYIGRIEGIAEKVIDIGIISDNDKLKIAEDTVNLYIEKYTSGIGDLSSVAKYDSIDTVKSDIHAVSDLIRWLNENNLLDKNANFYDKISVLKTEKLNELFDKLTNISFGTDVVKKITEKLLTDTIGEEYSDQITEFFSSMSDSDDLKETVLGMAEVAPIISEIKSGSLSDEEIDEKIDEAMEAISSSPLIDDELYADIEEKIDELRKGNENATY